jgi:hypothetical protein
MLTKFLAQESVLCLQIQYNTTNFYEQNVYLSLKFILTTLFGCNVLNRFINNRWVGDDSSLPSTSSRVKKKRFG